MEAIINTVDLNLHKRGFNVFDIQSGVFIQKLAEFFKDKNIIRTPSKVKKTQKKIKQLKKKYTTNVVWTNKFPISDKL